MNVRKLTCVCLGAVLALAITGCPGPTNTADGGGIPDVGQGCSPACTGTTPKCSASLVCQCTASPNSCPYGQTCNSSGVCAAPSPCNGVTCATGETCEAATGLCKCTGSPAQGTCPTGQLCSTTSRCLPVADTLCLAKACADATLPTCIETGTPAVAKCVCGPTSCGTGKACWLDGTCIDTTVPCSPACTGQTPACAGGSCKCTTGSCTSPKVCNLTSGVCETVFCDHAAKCAGKECGDDGCNPAVSCGTCTDPKICNGATQLCVNPPDCAPACKADEWCDHSRSIDCATDNCCAKICHDPEGCSPSQVCVRDPVDAGVAHSGNCQNVTCNGVLCGDGQICYDLAKMNGGPKNEVCTCTPGLVQGTTTFTNETCPTGMVCDMPLADVNGHVAKASTCALPGELEQCEMTPGCGVPSDCQVADGGTPTCQLDCVGGFTSGGKSVKICLRTCKNAAGAADSKKCGLAYTYCDSANLGYHCWRNDCADPTCPAGSPAGCTDASERAKFLKPCKATTGLDGTCMQMVFSDGELGVCFQGGSALDRAMCDANAARSQSGLNPTMCKAGSWCAAIHADSTNPMKEVGTCQKLCNAATGTSPNPALPCADLANDTCVACYDQGYCFDSSWPNPDGTEASADKTNMGYCLTKCDMFGTTACADDALTPPEHRGCFPLSTFDGTGFCQELAAAPAAIGATCPLRGLTDMRSSCVDRAVCLSYGGAAEGKCYGWCKHGDCTDQAGACGTCNPGACATCTPSCPASPACGADDGCGGKCLCTGSDWCNGHPDAGSVPGNCSPCTFVCPFAMGVDAGTGTVQPCGTDNGCGGKCGCLATEKCDTTGTCVACTPVCNNAFDAGATPQKCGLDDGCGHLCGCAAGAKCDMTKHICVECVPNCMNRACGDDGCGGSCGTCGAGKACNFADQNETCAPYNAAGGDTALELCTPL